MGFDVIYSTHEALKFSMFLSFYVVYLYNNKQTVSFYACTVESYKIQFSDENANNPYRPCLAGYAINDYLFQL